MTTDNLSAWQLEPVEDFSGFTPERRLRHLVSWAVLAPNAHNAQPWRFELRLTNRDISVFVDPSGLLRHSDAVGREAVVGLGCAFENLAWAARLYGWTVEEEIVAPSPFDEGMPFAHLRIVDFGQGRPLTDERRSVLLAMRNRRMNRSKYTSQPIAASFRQLLEESTEAPVELHLLSDTPTRVALSELQYIADRAVVAMPSFRSELAGHLLLNDDATSTTGMPGHTLGLGDQAAKELKQELERGGLLSPRWTTGLANADRDGLRSAPLIVVLSVPSEGSLPWFRVGRVLQRIAVHAEHHGLSVACNAAMVESTALNRMLKLRLGCRGRPTAVFRIGYSSEPRRHSPRRAEAEVARVVPG